MYTNRAWVVLDGDEGGRKVIQELRDEYATEASTEVNEKNRPSPAICPISCKLRKQKVYSSSEVQYRGLLKNGMTRESG